MKRMFSFWLAISKNGLEEYVRDLYSQYGPDIQYNAARFDLAEFKSLPAENMKNVLSKTLSPSSTIRTVADMKDYIKNFDERSKLINELKVSQFIFI